MLEANHDPRAAMVLDTAQRLLHDSADHITDDGLRQSFLENVATHRELLCTSIGGGALAVASAV